MFKRLRRHPLGFVGSLPKTVAAKPKELLTDISLVWGVGRPGARSARAGGRRRQPGGR